MNAIHLARRYADAGIPIPCDIAFDLLAQGVDPDAFGGTYGGTL